MIIDKNNILYFILIIKAKINLFFQSFLRIFLNTKKIEGISSDKKKNLYPRYLIVKLINNIIIGLKFIRNYFDVRADKIQIVKNYSNGDKTMILDSKYYWKNYVSIKDIINYIDKNDKKNDKMLPCIIMKFELHNPDLSPICLKEHIIKYKDYTSEYHHTLHNIIMFNGINIDEKKAELKIVTFNKGKLITKKIPYYEIYNNHINYFYDANNFIENNN